MKKFISFVLAGLLLSAPVMAQTVSTPTPSAVGTAVIGQIPGVSTNTAASTGNIGEILTSTVASGSAVNLSNNTPVNLTSLSLTAGNWDAECTAEFGGSLGITTALAVGATNTTGALIDGVSGFAQATFGATITPSNGVVIPTGRFHVSLASTSTVYCVVRALFSTGAPTVYGQLRVIRTN